MGEAPIHHRGHHERPIDQRGERGDREGRRPPHDREGIGSIVTDAGEPVGIVTERDTLARVVSLCRDPCETRISEIMSSPLITIPKETEILAAMRKLREDRVRRLCFTDDGKIVGIVTERDIIRAAALLMTEKEIGSIMVTDACEPVGIVTERDIIRAVAISSLTSFSILLRKRR